MRRKTISALGLAAALACATAMATTSMATTPTAGTASGDPRAGEVIFSDDFENGNLDQWSYQACPDGVQVVDDVARSGKSSAKFTVGDDDTSANCDDVPTENPRAQLVSDGMFGEGDEYFVGLSIYFPKDFPTPPDWFQLSEIYGQPFGGSPSMGLGIREDRISFDRDEQHGYDSIWQTDRPLVRGAWQDIVLHIKFSTNADEGFVEIWHNGAAQTMANGTKRTNYQTLVPGVNWDGTPNSVFINQYRSSEPMGEATLYHDDVRVGTTYESVAR